MSRKHWRAVATVWVAGALAGCTAGDDGGQAEQVALARQADDLAAGLGETLAEGPDLIVRLAFGEEADLDLYVTDPLLDTVYFARHESRTGGRISADVRCDSSGSRIEEVRFDAPWAGRYRVGVDHPKRCDGASPPAPAAYAVTAQVNGKTYTASGSVAVEQFQLVVLEFELQEGSADAQLAETN
ncbi:MAG: hypothetical protein VB948_13960 [Pseudomonadales bacterium]|jgi:hypothetical protein